jgi:hypothetical protein
MKKLLALTGPILSLYHKYATEIESESAVTITPGTTIVDGEEGPVVVFHFIQADGELTWEFLEPLSDLLKIKKVAWSIRSIENEGIVLDIFL